MGNRGNLYAVMGNPIEHSLSPYIHPLFAAQCNRSIEYEKICVALDGFPAAATSFFARPRARGLNITVPFKQQAYRLCALLSTRAQQAGAVNTIYHQSEDLYGDNTDGAGLVRDIEQNLCWEIDNKNIVVLGAGGAVRGILPALLEKSEVKIKVLNRTLEKALDLKKQFPEIEVAPLIGADGSITQPIDLLINGTSAFLNAEAFVLPQMIFNPNALAYDLIYSAQNTPFMEWAKLKGATAVSDGLGMLVEQAAESFALWESFHPETASVIEAMRKKLTTA